MSIVIIPQLLLGSCRAYVIVESSNFSNNLTKFEAERNGRWEKDEARPAIHVYFEYICWKFAGRLLDCVNTLLLYFTLLT